MPSKLWRNIQRDSKRWAQFCTSIFSELYTVCEWPTLNLKDKVLYFQISLLECSSSAQPCSSVSWEQNGYYAAQDFCVYHRRMWDEFMRVLSVAHAIQPVERAENLEYCNQLSGVCWDAVYYSVDSIFLNHPVFLSSDEIFLPQIFVNLRYFSYKFILSPHRIVNSQKARYIV